MMAKHRFRATCLEVIADRFLSLSSITNSIRQARHSRSRLPAVACAPPRSHFYHISIVNASLAKLQVIAQVSLRCPQSMT